jgi:hypothetical protein
MALAQTRACCSSTSRSRGSREERVQLKALVAIRARSLWS